MCPGVRMTQGEMARSTKVLGAESEQRKSIFKFSPFCFNKEVTAEVSEDDLRPWSHIQTFSNEVTWIRNANKENSMTGRVLCVPDCNSLQRLKYIDCAPSLEGQAAFP